MKKLITGISTGITSALIFVPSVFAATVEINPCGSDATLDTSTAGAFKTKLCTLGTTDAGSVIRNIIVAVFVVITVLSLFFLIRGGINWILSGGDKGKVEASQKMIVAAIVGLIIAFLSYFILNLVLSLFGLSFGNLTIPNITGK